MDFVTWDEGNSLSSKHGKYYFGFDNTFLITAIPAGYGPTK